mmetsp:Transcript_19247/g.58005  ORF Transcript_19247/g.58005 Transcript_19247/m.58005 type:complete len:210 (+) Transcript_19247:1165-1794(+)
MQNRRLTPPCVNRLPSTYDRYILDLKALLPFESLLVTLKRWPHTLSQGNASSRLFAGSNSVLETESLLPSARFLMNFLRRGTPSLRNRCRSVEVFRPLPCTPHFNFATPPSSRGASAHGSVSASCGLWTQTRITSALVQRLSRSQSRPSSNTRDSCTSTVSPCYSCATRRCPLTVGFLHSNLSWAQNQSWGQDRTKPWNPGPSHRWIPV